MKTRTKALGAIKAIIQLPQRVVVRGFDDISERIVLQQKEAYEDLLIDALIDPAKAADLRKYIDAVKPTVYLMTQAFARGGHEALESLATRAEGYKSEAHREVIKAQEGQRDIRQGGGGVPQQEVDALEGNIQGMNVPQLNMPLFDQMPTVPSYDFSQSPTVVPSASDREIAERLARRNSGVAGLV